MKALLTKSSLGMTHFTESLGAFWATSQSSVAVTGRRDETMEDSPKGPPKGPSIGEIEESILITWK